MITGTIALRKLTLKSKMDGINDIYKGWTIEQMVKFKPHVLLKTYYYYEKITFTEEVINLLKGRFKEFIEIPKPSFNKDMYEQVSGAEKSLEDVRKTIAYMKINKRKIPNWLIQLYYCKKNEHSIVNKPMKVLSKIELRTLNQKVRQ